LITEKQNNLKGGFLSDANVEIPVVGKSPTLLRYLKTGNAIRNKSHVMELIEEDVTETIKRNFNNLLNPSLFLYVEGSSGLGKTQLAFNFKRRVLYLPLGINTLFTLLGILVLILP
jgi:hypothetical protein